MKSKWSRGLPGELRSGEFLFHSHIVWTLPIVPHCCSQLRRWPCGAPTLPFRNRLGAGSGSRTDLFSPCEQQQSLYRYQHNWTQQDGGKSTTSSSRGRQNTTNVVPFRFATTQLSIYARGISPALANARSVCSAFAVSGKAEGG